MTDYINTDSLFTSAADHVTGTETWSDLRLVHESECGWSVVCTGLYRGRRVAIKGIKKEFRSNEFHRSLLKKEFAVMSGLSHQNIVAVLWMQEVPDIGESILMEYIDGVTLADYLDANRRPDSKRIVDILVQLCSAVAYMHSKHTIHCDLKPSNVMITSSGFVKVIDFGMSRGNGFEKLDFQGGTKGYTAPENFNSDSKATGAVDIYSIGKILELMDVDGSFKGLWKKCLSSDPKKRPATAIEISEQLTEICLKHKQRKSLYAAVGISIGIAVLSVNVFMIWRSVIDSRIEDIASENFKVVDLAPVNGELPDSTQSPNSTQSPTVIENNREQPLNSESATKRESVSSDMSDETDSDTRPFKDQLSEKLKQVVKLRFKQHLELIDTMTTVRSNELQGVGHWRWLAKQDMRKWLEEKLAPNYPKIEETMKDVERWIEWEADFSYRKGIESSHRADAIERCPELAGWTTQSAYYVGIDEGVVRKLGEDGIWREERIKVHNDRTDPEATMKALNEKMRKAMEKD